MRIAIVHGYFLHDSGSGIYVRELTRELVRQGHDVTLVCQERRPELYDFIDSVYELDETDTRALPLVQGRDGRYPGRCRLVRPNLGGRLLVYAEGSFPGFDRSQVKAFQNSSEDSIEHYVASNMAALLVAFSAWPPELVLAGHVIMQPYIVERALVGAAPYVVTVHGSELNFSLKRDPRLVPYALTGLSSAAAVVAVSQPSAEDTMEWARSNGLEIRDKTWVVPPGIDGDTFTPAPSRAEAIEALRRDVVLPEGFDIRPEDDVLAFAGALRRTKGIQHVLAALPLIAAERPRVRLLVAGDGPARPALERLSALLQNGDCAGARQLTEVDEDLRTPAEFGDVVLGAFEGAEYPRVAFLGHLTHQNLARVFAAADASIAPSVFPEAVGLVNIEALSAGSLPIASYHSGTTTLVDVLTDSLADPAFRRLAPGRCLTEGLARLVVRSLQRYPTSDPAFRSRLHDLAALHFPSWNNVAGRYLELGLGSPVGSAAVSVP